MDAPASGSRFGRFVTWWLEPRATDRDLAFRERTIRSALAIIIILALVSFALSAFVFRDPWRVVSVPTMHIAALTTCFLSGWAVARGRLLLSGWLLSGTVLLGVSLLVILARQEGVVSRLFIGAPAFMFPPLIAALIFPRNHILPISILSIILYIVSQFVLPVGDFSIPGLEASELIGQIVALLLIEGLVLRQLRIEFDARLDAMEDSMQQAELARQQAEAADKAKSQFLANMSHELRTPLNAVIGYADAMLGGMAGDFTTQQSTLLGHMQHNSRRLLGLINDVLDLSKIESGSMKLRITPIAPRQLINETVDGLRSLASGKRIYVRVVIDEKLPEFFQSDADKIQQILVNLISNAVKFTDQGGVTIRANAAEHDTWELSVQDSGIGIPPEALDDIFDPFQQVDGSSTRKYRGTGLGLAIVKRLVDHMEGTIQVESQPNQGSTFTIMLPFVALPDPQEVR